jgi:class 3 adenylate cyclase
MQDPSRPGLDDEPNLIAAGHAAYDRHAWTEAYDLLSRADATTPLGGADLELLAEVAFFAARAHERIEIKERAFAAHQAAGDTVRAANQALGIAYELGMRGRHSLASSWTARAERLLEGQPEAYPHAFLALLRGEEAWARGDRESAITLATEAVGIATRTGDRDLHAMALASLAMFHISSGAATEGMALLEEAALAAVSGELSPITAGVTSCQMISVCRDLTDYQRAQEWLEATDRWCKRQEVSGFPGICRVHRAEIVAMQGGWDRAELELTQATSDLEAYGAVPPMADGLYGIGEIRRLRGDLEGAEAALRQAHAFGRTPQPALAFIRLAAGNVRSATASIASALDEQTTNQWARGRLLAAQVEIALAAGDPALARAAVDELARINEGYRSPALEAGQRAVLGRVLLAEGDVVGAVRELRTAIRSWREVGAPYEVARARSHLSMALRALGDPDDAALELQAARDEFERLGAVPDLRAAESQLRELEERASRPGQRRMTFMFTDIEGSTSLAEALGNEAWERILQWHDDTLRGLVARHGGRVVKPTGDGFFVAFDDAARAIACAVAIQRALDDHRRSSGFAPSVRIGLHTADATQRGSDYSGVGVHVASRVAALGRGGEIHASSDTLVEAPETTAGWPREVAVKGVSTPLSVASVDWAP